jgi:post-segregation antitoxin (ccd killing protein)
VHAQVEAVRIGYTIRKQEETKVLFLDRARALKYNISRLTQNTLLI